MGIFPTFIYEGGRNPQNVALEGKNILLIGTGSISAMYLPAWISWFTEKHPTSSLRVVLTPSALRFVGPSALCSFSRSSLEIDSWEGHETEAYHVDLYTWADAYVVYPATADYIARFAMGSCDSPVLLALQSTQCPVILAPALPPGFLESEAWRIHRDALVKRRNIHLMPPIVGRSSYDESIEAFPPQPFTKVIGELELLIGNRDIN